MSDVLRRARLVHREIFDPSNPEHVESFKTFLRTGSWGALQFWPEAPYTEAPATVMAKYARHVLDVQPESEVERAERVAARGILSEVAPVEDKGLRLARANELISKQIAELAQ